MKEKEYFDKVADVFDTHLNVYAKPAGELRVKRRIELFSRHCQLRTGLRVLEIGCGTGEYTKGLLERCRPLFCTDISFNMIKKAREKSERLSSLYSFVCDIEQLPLKDSIFDAVVGNSILHHIDTNVALRQIFRVLKDGGRFAFSEPNMFNPQIFLQKNIKFIKKISGDTPGEKAFYRWQIKRMFEKAGFKNIKVAPFDFLHPHTPNFIIKTVEKIGLALEKTFLREIAGSLLIVGTK